MAQRETDLRLLGGRLRLTVRHPLRGAIVLDKRFGHHLVVTAGGSGGGGRLPAA